MFLLRSVGAARPLLLALLIGLLSACGGADPVDEPPSAAAGGADARPRGDTLLEEWARHAESGQPLVIEPDDETQVHLGQAARLNRRELLEHERIAAGTDAQRKAARKAFSGLVPVYRFLNRNTSAHFYTIDEAERDRVIATMPQFNYEGPAFLVSPLEQVGLLPVHRFFNTATGVHLYTISEDERNYIQANLPRFVYEGVAYHASPTGGAGLKPLYRFYRPDRGLHFYTAAYTERDSVIASLCAYRYEGTSYYVMDPAAVAEPPPATPNAVVLVVGDSLSQGYGTSISGRTYSFVSPGRVWTQRLATEIRTRTGRNCNRLINVSVGGMRTDHGLARIQGWLNQYAPTHVILAQGTNDAWQNRGAWSIEANLAAMAQASNAAQAQVYVMDFYFYPKGSAYRQGLTALYQRVAASHSGRYVAGTGGIPLNGTYYHPDEVHLRDAAQPAILENTWQALLPSL